MPDVICEICFKRFHVRPAVIKRGGGKTCSMKCMSENQKTRFTGPGNPRWRGGVLQYVDRVCLGCGNTFKAYVYNIVKGYGKFCSHSCRSVHTMSNMKKKNTSIEIAVENEFKSLGIKYIRDFPIYGAKTVPDFFIAPNICIYCDGDYWHNRPEAIAKDARQNFVLVFLGYKVYRFWEHEIKIDIKQCIGRIKYGI